MTKVMSRRLGVKVSPPRAILLVRCESVAQAHGLMERLFRVYRDYGQYSIMNRVLVIGDVAGGLNIAKIRDWSAELGLHWIYKVLVCHNCQGLGWDRWPRRVMCGGPRDGQVTSYTSWRPCPASDCPHKGKDRPYNY